MFYRLNKTIRNLSFSLLIISALLMLQSAAHAQLDIAITGGTVRGIPIAVVPFKTVDGAAIGTEIDRVVSADLGASGKFEPLEVNAFMSMPSRAEEVRFKDWRFIDAEALVIGEVWQLGEDSYEVQFRIFDVARQQEIGSGQRIPNLRERDLRSAAHIISDNVYRAFLGRPGAFNSRIAFIKHSKVDETRNRYRLMVADWDGYGEQEVYASWNPLISPSWSPDSSKLAFVSFTDSGSVVRVLDLRTGQHEVIAAFKGVNAAPAWSPDGRRLAYSTSKNGSPDIYIYDLGTKQHTRVTTHYAIDTEPAWSPDGRSVLFTSSRTGKPQIYAHNLVSSETKRVTFAGDESANASMDYENKRMVIVHDGGKIAVMDNADGEITFLTNAKFDESPSFSPNGDMVLYASEQGYEPVIMVASSDGRVRQRLEFVSGDVREPAWSALRN